MSDGNMIGFGEAARMFERAGQPPVHTATLTKWARFGVATPAGRVRLKAVKLGRVWGTTAAWVDEFVAAVTAASVTGDEAIIATPAEKNKAADAAVAELAAMGI